MRVVLYLCVITSVLLFLGAVPGLCSDSDCPIEISLSMSAPPALNEQAWVECTLRNREVVKFNDVALTLKLPDGVECVDGDLSWQGELAPLETRTFSIQIRVNSPGNKDLGAVVLVDLGEGNSCGDTNHIFFHSNTGSAQLGYVYETVPTETACVSPKTGELGAPRKLSSLRTMAVEKPYTPPAHDINAAESDVHTAGLLPGSLVVKGRWVYYDRSGNQRPLRNCYVELITNIYTPLASTYTNSNGDYTFSSITNPGLLGFRVRVWCYYRSSVACDDKALRVVNEGDGRLDGGNLLMGYNAVTSSKTSGDGTYDIGTWSIKDGDANEPAWWIMQDLLDGFWWPYQFDNGARMPGGVTVEWSPTSTHGDHNHRDGDDGGNIHLESDSPNVCDVVIHEYGHEVQWDGYDGWFPETGCPSPHYIQKGSSANCAWTEGFANWYKMAVTNDPVYHWANGGTLDLETATWGTGGWDNGDTCEGRVAGALWDLGDSSVDGIDTSALGWYSIWVTWYNHRDNNFRDFWNRWKNNSLPTHNTLKAFFQNTVDYDTAPTFSGLPNVYLYEDEFRDNVLDFHAYASDPESQDAELSFTVEVINYPQAGITVDSSRYLDVYPQPNHTGSSRVLVHCSDGAKETVDEIMVVVLSVNDPPQWGTAPKVILTEDQFSDNAVDLWSFSSDLESADSELTYSILGKPGDYKTGPALDSNRYIDFNPAADWYGMESLTVRVTDPQGLYADKTFSVTVLNVNDPPKLTPISDFSVNEDTSVNNIIDLWAYASDETADPDLVFLITNTPAAGAGVSIDSNRYIDVSPQPNWCGTTSVTLRVTDTNGTYTEDTFDLTVYAINDVPVWTPLPNRTLYEDSTYNNAVDLWSYVSDVETADSALVFSVVSTTSPQCGVTLDSNRYIDIVPTANWNGTCTATIRAHDGASYTDTELFITVNAVNDIPVWSTLPDKTLNEDTILDNAIDLHAYVQDVETPDPGLVFSITGNTNPSCGVSIDGNRYLDIRPAANWFGTSTVTIRCTDGILQASDVIVITVNPVNDPPTIDSLADVLVAKGSSNNDAVHISEYGWDIDDNLGTLTFSIVSMTNANCGAVIDSNEFIDINPTATWTGYSDVKVRVTDPAGLYVEDTFRIVAAQFVDRLSEARSSNMAWVAVRDKTVTAKFTDFMYVEEQDRSSGLKLYHYQSVTPGQKVTAAGPVYTVNSERHLTVYYFTINGSTQQIRPLAMPNGALGGEAPNAYTPSVPPGAAGLYNVGMLVSTSGQVMYLAPGGQFYISDGSSVIDSRISTGEPWLLIDKVSTGWQPALGSYVTVTGISSVSTVGGSPVRMLRPRNQQDIRVW